jgi:Bacteriophage Mu Gam like protein
MTAQPLSEFDGPEAPQGLVDVTDLGDPDVRLIAPDGEPFRIVADAMAEWALRKLAAVRAKKAENDSIAEAEVQRVTLWVQGANSALDHDEQYFVGLLSDYARRERDEHGRKSVVLPHGAVKSRSSAAKVRVIDPEVFTPWAQENATELLRVTVAPAQAAINEQVEITEAGAVFIATGEVVPGVTVDPATIKYTVTTD